MIRKFDKKNRFVSIFEPRTGFYMRTGVLGDSEYSDAELAKLSFKELEKFDTNVDPFMCSFPELLDIGIMQTCVCAHKCQVDCYQKAIDRKGANMSLEDYEKIMKQCEGKVLQVAIGGAGDVDTHENFEEILKFTRQYGIVPNFTTSGILMTKEKAEICKKYCGAVAVSDHEADYTERALNYLLEAGVTTNIHYVLGNRTIDRAIQLLKTNGFKKGINAVVFLLYKPVGLGKEENMLLPDDPRVKEFFKLVDEGTYPFRIGFDSCCCPGIINNTNKVNLDSLDFCEGARFSAYIDANMNMMPCSFANQDPSWFTNLRDHTIQEIWDGELFDKFRYSLSHSCSSCPNRSLCGGGCPLVNQITLCDRAERNFVKGK